MDFPTGYLIGESIIRLHYLVILAACIIYVRRARSWEGILALASHSCLLALSATAMALTVGRFWGKIETETIDAVRPWIRVPSLALGLVFAISLVCIALKKERKLLAQQTDPCD